MHVVNPHWVSGTRQRCQAIAVLISLQLCLISSVEANHLTVGELGSPDTDTVEPTWKRLWGTLHLIHYFYLQCLFIWEGFLLPDVRKICHLIILHLHLQSDITSTLTDFHGGKGIYQSLETNRSAWIWRNFKLTLMYSHANTLGLLRY